jgi:hypothetical protein
MPTITANHMRCPSGTNIKLVNNTGRVLIGPVIGRNIDTSDGATRLDIDNPANWIVDLPPQAVIARSSGPSTNLTGTTAKTLMASFTLKANRMWKYGLLKVWTSWTFAGTSGTRTTDVELGATPFNAVAVSATNLSATLLTQISNQGAVNSQVGTQSAFIGLGQGAVAPASGSVDTTADQIVSIYMTLANSGDSATLNWWYAELIPG